MEPVVVELGKIREDMKELRTDVKDLQLRRDLNTASERSERRRDRFPPSRGGIRGAAQGHEERMHCF